MQEITNEIIQKKKKIEKQIPIFEWIQFSWASPPFTRFRWTKQQFISFFANDFFNFLGDWSRRSACDQFDGGRLIFVKFHFAWLGFHEPGKWSLIPLRNFSQSSLRLTTLLHELVLDVPANLSANYLIFLKFKLIWFLTKILKVAGAAINSLKIR